MYFVPDLAPCWTSREHQVFLHDLGAVQTSAVNDTLGAALTSDTRNKFPEATAFSLNATERSRTGLKVSGITGEGSRLAFDSEARSTSDCIWEAIVMILR